MNQTESKDTFMRARNFIKSLPVTKATRFLVNVLEQECFFAGKLVKQCKNVYYSQGGSAHDQLDAITEMVNTNERRCLAFRQSVDDMCRTTGVTSSISDKKLPQKVDITEDTEFSYDEKTNTLRVKFPILLPLKPTWNRYIPDKIRRGIEMFDEEYKAKTGNQILFNHALVLLIHHYDDEKRVENYYRDFDNQEWSSTLNALHASAMFNDAATTMISMQMASPDTTSFTEVVITDVERVLDIIGIVAPHADTSFYQKKGLELQNSLNKSE